LGTALLVAAFLAVGAAAWALQLRPPLVVDASPLDALPPKLADWVSVDVPLETTVEAMLRADYNVQRLYRHPLGDVVWVYFGYYGTDRGGRPEHTPVECFRAHGWEVAEPRSLEVDGPSGLRVEEFVVAQGGSWQLVHYWFRSHRSTGLRGGVDQTLDRLFGRLLGGRADGSLVRISTPLRDGDRVSARSRLLPFAAALDRQLAAHWPRETVGD
jgi:EpsI family protein